MRPCLPSLAFTPILAEHQGKTSGYKLNPALYASKRGAAPTRDPDYRLPITYYLLFLHPRSYHGPYHD